MSELLPRQYADFRKKEYWDEFFQKRSEKAFEWYGDYAQLRRGLHVQLSLDENLPPRMAAKLKGSLRVLVVGCGNSELSKDLYDDGFTNIVSVDFSELVIEEMRKKHPQLQWQVMDMTQMTAFADASFDVVLDKGALDALMAADTDEIKADATKMLTEVERVLANGGRYFCVTMAQDFILAHLLTYFCQQAEASAWSVAVHEIPRDARKPFVPFLVTLAKAATVKRHTTAVYNNKSFVHSNSAARQQWLVHEVEATQWYTMTQAGLKKLQVGRQEIIELIANDRKTTPAVQTDGVPSEPVPRFTLRLVDNSACGHNGSCAVFLIPQGREHEWMFATEEGAEELASGAGFSRLIIVQLGRGHVFESTTQVQEELNGKILELAPDTMRTDEKIPYLTVQEGLGARNIVHQGHSAVSGEYFIEEVEDAGDHLRRLVFLSNSNMIQSEVKLVKAPVAPAAAGASASAGASSAAKKKKNKKKKKANALTVDASYLGFDFHKAMVAVLHAASFGSLASAPHRSLLVGLGGGCLAKYLHDQMSTLTMTACELDPTIVQVAEQYFGFKQDERMKVVVADGIEYLAKQAANATPESRFDSILIDVDAKERNVGMSCPPVSFVQESFFKNVYATLNDGGVLAVNISCRDTALFKEILQRLVQVFSSDAHPATVFQLRPNDQDMNRVVFIHKETTPKTKVGGNALLKELKEQGKRKGRKDLPAYVDEELCELVRDIQLA